MPEVSIGEEQSFGRDFERVVLACCLQNSKFFERFRGLVSENAFEDKDNRSLVFMLQEYWKKYKQVPSTEVFKDAIRASSFKSPGGMIAVLEALPEIHDVEYVSEKVISWAKWTAIDAVLSDPSARKDTGKFAKDVDKAARTGDSLLLQHTTLDEDREGEEVRNEVVESPWAWLNSRLLGGPERKDLVIVMTVINGGKTTILTNVAGSCLASGRKGVFFTFEDGEAKIKRRLLQWINGWTTEQIMADIDEARQRRTEWLEATGGQLHIKQLKSRRSSVEDAMSFVKSVQDATGEKIDFVVTDYADRFRPEGRYNEPRHALREVYEDLKYMASDLDIVHWSASQINTKQMIGKDIVGIEHGSESTGKFESADLCLGFGQTMEDQRRGLITMFTSKVRDGAKSETTSLVADFARQRIYQLDDQEMRP